MFANLSFPILYIKKNCILKIRWSDAEILDFRELEKL